jgi:3-deoxy-D-manno-octulosonate 8-phosphate phosphatase (KDO 8-P phosphatase)
MVKLVVYDFDGVLTDNRVLVHQDGTESVFCNRSDGWWIKEIRKLGVEQVILSTEKNPVVKARADKIGLPCTQGVDDKLAGLKKLLAERNLPPEQVCYVGNEMNDVDCMKTAGHPLAPQDGHPEILRIAKHVLPCNGGAGIVRHVHDWLVAKR